MKYFMNLTTRSKLLLSFGLICILFLLIIFIAYKGIKSITQSEKELYNRDVTIALELRELRAHQNFNRAALLDMMLTQVKSEQMAIEASINEKSQEIDKIISELSVLANDPMYQSQFNELRNIINTYRETRKDEVSYIQSGKLLEAQKVATTLQKDRFEKIRSLTAEMGDEAEKRAHEQLAADMHKAGSSILLFVLLGIAAVFLSVIIIVIMNSTIAKPLNELAKIASDIGEGNINIEMTVSDRRDEVGILIHNFHRMAGALKNMASAGQRIAEGDLTVAIVPQSDKDILGNVLLKMQNNLQKITKEILDIVNSIATASTEILAATTQVASGAAETAAAITETTTTVEEVRQAAQLSHQKASRVSENAQQIATVTQIGHNTVEETINGMDEIKKQMEVVASTIVRLSEQSQQIGGIIASVTDIADQSNLLAVNAAIEAAKAGEQGKGFSVVAQEIKSLAQQSKQATIEVRNILNDVQKATSAAVMATEQTTKTIESGVKQSSQSGEAIKKLAESSVKAVDAATQIVASSQQQVVGMDQIGVAMQNINQAGTEIAASMVQAEKAAKELAELGQKLKILVDKYKI
jgi:methyl-accepting chemotaxis protein